MDVLVMLEAHGVDLTKVRAWVPCYFPFIMGGNVWHAGGAELPCERPIMVRDIGVCEIRGPDGMTAVCELTTGAVVGETIEQVRRDIEDAYARDDLGMMRKQIDDAQAYLQRGFTTLKPEEFWRRMRLAREKKGTKNG